MSKNNKVAWLCACLLLLTVSLSHGQEAYVFPGPKPRGPADDFKFTIEPAWVMFGKPNTMGKGKLEKKFFPGHNRIVEFFLSHSFQGYHGFRVDTINTNNYIMEVVWITDFKETNRKASEEFPTKSFMRTSPYDMPEEERKEMREFNRQQRLKRSAKIMEEYTIERMEIPISTALYTQIYKSFHGIMRNYSSKGIAPTSFDGYSVTFRCVIESIRSSQAQ